ncbi:hypothetical protein JY651_04305 [Pyxidicoccus parkwayensis]|uniref:Gluconate 2-dehydrogenase subunit 3 family protein n=1 Tax=Pyxidicoccus parkwayensis TaxID=2813578 RepID=A0ABX7NZG2_9BACT|nr:gluconate 2-dehydrogenase subunit 3 family protein [Pyxidicoccus parkwaysis]QSQ24200.1 hypothetical protein JY651_04305 [Pyxidicoccus parkwaysis]
MDVSLTRRRLLKRGLFGGALLALGGSAVLASRDGLSLPVPEGLQVLGPREYATLQALARRAFPARAGWPDADTARVAVVADGLLARGDPSVAKEVKDLLGLFDNALAGFLFSGRVTPFSRLSPEEQDAAFEDWRTSRLVLRRSAHHALRTLVHSAYYMHPAVSAAAGYVPPEGFHDANAVVWKGEGPRPAPLTQKEEGTP